MADHAKSTTAQTQTQPSSTPCDPVNTSLRCTDNLNLPASVVDAINKSSDLIPALFAIPCDSRDTKKLKLCKKVGWLRDGVFTTGYVEVNVQEAKQKGIFSRPRRVTIVQKNDSRFQSVAFAAGSGKPTCEQLSNAMLKRNPSQTAMIEVNRDIIPSTITVDKGSLLTMDTPGKLVALKTQVNERDETSTSPHAIGDTQEKNEYTETRNQSLEANKTIVESTDIENNNTSTLSSTKEQNMNLLSSIEPPGDERNKLPAADYVLTEDGTTSPLKRKSEPTFAPCVSDISDSPAFRTLQNLMHIADANHNKQNTKNDCTGVSGDHHSNRPAQETQRNKQSMDFPDKALEKNSSASSSNVSKTLETKLLAGKCEPKLEVFKLSVDFSFEDIKEGMMLSVAEIVSEQKQDVQTPSIEATPKADRTQAPKMSQEPKVKTPQEKLADRQTVIGDTEAKMEDSHTVKSRSDTCHPSLTVSKGGQDTGTSSDACVESVDSSLSTDVQALQDKDSTTTQLSEVHPKTKLHASKSENNSTSEREATQDTPTVSQQQTEATPPIPSSASTRPEGTQLSLSNTDGQFHDKSDGYPALKIGSVYSLSEKEAKMLFPNLHSPQPSKSVQISQDPIDDHTYSSPAVPDAAIKTSPLHASGKGHTIGDKPQIPSHSSEKVCQFPSLTNPKLYNITPVKGSSENRKILTPVTTIGPVIHPNQRKGLSTMVVHHLPSPGNPNKKIHRLIPYTATPISNLNQHGVIPRMPVNVMSGPIAVTNRPTTAVAPAQSISGLSRLVHSSFVNSTALPSTPSASSTPKIPAILKLPVTTQSPSSIKIVMTGGKNSRSEAVSGLRAASTTTVCHGACTNRNTSKPATTVSTAVRLSASTHTITVASKPSSGPIIANVPPDSRGISAVSKVLTTTKAVKVVCPLPKEVSLAKEKIIRQTVNENQHIDTKAFVSVPRKTFLITTSGGEKRLVSLPETAGAAIILSKMANKKAYKVVLPQTPKKAQPEETKVKKESDTDANTRAEIQRPKTPETSSLKSVHKHKRHKKKKSHKKSEEAREIRKSSRERKLKRPYSPSRSPSNGSKIARGESPTLAPDRAIPYTQDITMPVIKTEPKSPEPYPDEMLPLYEDQLQSQPLSPPSYVDRGDRVRRLKELMKEKERALEEMRQRRKQQMEERLADPQLCDL